MTAKDDQAGWIRVGVHISDATDEADANAQCKRRPAYRNICEKYPSATWERRYAGTTRQGAGWFVEFEVRPKA